MSYLFGLDRLDSDKGGGLLGRLVIVLLLGDHLRVGLKQNNVQQRQHTFKKIFLHFRQAHLRFCKRSIELRQQDKTG